ncbi:MAG: hypothetical protein KBD31_03370 [Proteobacteria bacterium]|nr:hypothetical protein [Pseudomonadota bacterium]
MLENAYFYLVLSFVLFVYIYVQKIHPLLKEQLDIYGQKIQKSLDETSLLQSHLHEKLLNARKESESIADKVRLIVANGQDMSEKLKESYNQSMAQLMIERQEMANKTMEKIKNKSEGTFYLLIAKEIQDLLIDWAKENSQNQTFQHNSFVHSFNLLSDSLKNDA